MNINKYGCIILRAGYQKIYRGEWRGGLFQVLRQLQHFLLVLQHQLRHFLLVLLLPPGKPTGKNRGFQTSEPAEPVKHEKPTALGPRNPTQRHSGTAERPARRSDAGMPPNTQAQATPSHNMLNHAEASCSRSTNARCTATVWPL